MVFVNYDVVKFLEHTLLFDVPSIPTTTTHSKGYDLRTEISLLYVGDVPNPTLRTFPYEDLAAKGGALKYKTRTQQWYLVLVYQVPGM